MAKPRLRVIFQNRDFSDRHQTHWDTLDVERYSKNAIGGPKRATLRATGSKMNVWEFVELLRCPVLIWDRVLSKYVWWGLVYEIKVQDEVVRWGISLDTMSNNVAVAHTYLRTRQTTDYSADSDSVAEYGTKDILLSGSDISEAEALSKRDNALASRKFPIPNFGTAGRGVAPSVTVKCRGWFDTLKWRYYESLTGKESYEVVGKSRREIGEDDRPKAAMSFQLSSAAGWTTNAIWLRAYKWKVSGGAYPVDNFLVDLFSDNAGVPNVSLASNVTAGANIAESSTWTEFVLDSSVALSTGTLYWIVVARSGGIDVDSFYFVDTNRDNGYANGSLFLWRTDPGEWVDREGKGDMLFKVVGELSTTGQISSLNTSVGEFITGTDIVNASGIDTSPFRDGDTTAMRELLDLLKSGTTNDRRLLADITVNRRMTVYEEAAEQSSDNAFKINSAGQLFGVNDQATEPTECTVAEWCYLLDVIPDTADVSKLAKPSPFFIEEAEYITGRGYRVVRVRDQRDVFDIGGVTQG